MNEQVPSKKLVAVDGELKPGDIDAPRLVLIRKLNSRGEPVGDLAYVAYWATDGNPAKQDEHAELIAAAVNGWQPLHDEIERLTGECANWKQLHDADEACIADLHRQLREAKERRATHEPPKEWRCFHCDEVLRTERDARLHFGNTHGSDPACLIKAPGEFALLTVLRNAEDELARHRSEDSDVLRAMWSMQADHATALRREEEKGYERGLGDAKAHPETLGLQRASEPPGDGCSKCSNVAPIANIRVGEDDTCEVVHLYAPGLPPGEHDLYPAASTPDREQTITALCDRIERIFCIAIDQKLTLVERIRQIQEWSAGFMQPPSPTKETSHG